MFQLCSLLLAAAIIPLALCQGAEVSFRHGVASSGHSYISTVLTVEPKDTEPSTIKLIYQVSTSRHDFSEALVVASGLANVAWTSEPGLVHATAIIDGVEPGQHYYYRFIMTDGPVSPLGAFHAPAPSDALGHRLVHLDRRHLREGAGVDAGAASTNFQLLHFNDVHNHIEGILSNGKTCTADDESKGTCMGGMARLASFVKEARQQGPTLVLDVGDEATGTVWDRVYPNHTVQALIQEEMGVDIFTLGNHEFDSGVDNLAVYLQQLAASGIPTLGGCNVDAAGEPSILGLFKKWEVKEVAGVKVGLLGWLTRSTLSQVNAARLNISDEVDAMRQCVSDFKAAHPDVGILVGVSHGGYLSDLQVAASVPDLDIIVGAHSHTFLWGTDGTERGPLLNASNPNSGEAPGGPYPTLVTGPRGRQVPVVQAACFSKYVGQLQLTFGPGGELQHLAGGPVLMGSSISANPVDRDPATLAIIDAHQGPVRELDSSVIGYTPVTLDGSPSLLRSQEAPLGNVVADALMWYVGQTTKTGADVAMINSGGIRASVDAGDITTADVYAVFPYGNLVSLISVMGAQLLAALENSASVDFSNPSGKFSQVSGLSFTLRKDAPVGSRVQSVDLLRPNGSREPLDPCRPYLLVCSDYQAAGGDGYSMLINAPRLIANGEPLDQAFSSYISAHNPLPSGVYGRIVDCTNSSSSSSCPPTRTVNATCGSSNGTIPLAAPSAHSPAPSPGSRSPAPGPGSPQPKPGSRSPAAGPHSPQPKPGSRSPAPGPRSPQPKPGSRSPAPGPRSPQPTPGARSPAPGPHSPQPKPGSRSPAPGPRSPQPTPGARSPAPGPHSPQPKPGSRSPAPGPHSPQPKPGSRSPGPEPHSPQPVPSARSPAPGPRSPFPAPQAH